MNKNDHSSIIHDCLEMKGKGGTICLECSVPKKRPCEVMVSVINNIIHSNVKGNLKGLNYEDVKDIVSVSITAIQNAEFKGETDGKFAAWVKGIVSNKKNDYFRRKYGEKETKGLDEDIILVHGQKDNESMESDTKIDEEVFISALKTINKEWSDFILECVDDMKKGLSHKDMAEKRNMIPNSFTKKLIRSKVELKKSEIIKEKFKDYL